MYIEAALIQQARVQRSGLRLLLLRRASSPSPPPAAQEERRARSTDVIVAIRHRHEVVLRISRLCEWRRERQRPQCRCVIVHVNNERRQRCIVGGEGTHADVGGHGQQKRGPPCQRRRSPDRVRAHRRRTPRPPPLHNLVESIDLTVARVAAPVAAAGRCRGEERHQQRQVQQGGEATPAMMMRGGSCRRAMHCIPHVVDALVDREAVARRARSGGATRRRRRGARRGSEGREGRTRVRWRVNIDPCSAHWRVHCLGAPVEARVEGGVGGREGGGEERRRRWRGGGTRAAAVGGFECTAVVPPVPFPFRVCECFPHAGVAQ